MYHLTVGLIIALLVVAGIAAAVILFIKNKNSRVVMQLSDRFKYTAAAYLCILVAFTNAYVNSGVVRELFFWVLVVHAAIFWAVTFFASGYTENSEDLEKAVALGLATFAILHIALPDFDGSGETFYTCFRLIQNDAVATVCISLAIIALLVNVVVIIRQLYLTFKLRS